MDIYIKGQKVKLKPSQSIGKGGEADVFAIGKGKALKIFKSPDHPDLQGSPHAQQAAQLRLQEQQSKLRAFPQNLPDHVVQPIELATDQQEQTILGYTMPLIKETEALLKYSQRSFRSSGISAQTVVDIFLDLHTTVDQLHQAQMVIGDFNDLNVLVKGTTAYLIDADSFQFQTFLCRMFTTPFVDPTLYDLQTQEMIPVKAFSPDSDWYAFAVMLMQSLLYVGPYGGVYRPQDPKHRIPQTARPLHRITVFHPEVRYPKPATPYDILPDPLLDHFHKVFELDYRGVWPRSLLDSLQWTTCTKCGSEHARSICPFCLKTGAIKQVIQVRGSVIASQVFRCEGVILHATMEQDQLRWLYWEHGAFYREDRSCVLQGDLAPQLVFGIQANATLVGKQDQVITLHPQLAPETLVVDSFQSIGRSIPVFAISQGSCYWLYQGQLLREGRLGPEYIGDVLEHQTRIWVGSRFGFGFYRAGGLQIGFTFQTDRPGLNDSVQLRRGSGQWLDAICYLTADRCWFLLATQEQGRTIHICQIIRSDGSIEASAETTKGDGSWLGTLQGHCVAGDFLLAATDEGIVRVEPSQGQIKVTKMFPDTEPFVDSNCHLLASSEGLYVIKTQTIHLLKIS